MVAAEVAIVMPDHKVVRTIECDRRSFLMIWRSANGDASAVEQHTSPAHSGAVDVVVGVTTAKISPDNKKVRSIERHLGMVLIVRCGRDRNAGRIENHSILCDAGTVNILATSALVRPDNEVVHAVERCGSRLLIFGREKVPATSVDQEFISQ
jgi:hypothetical protein